MNVKWINKRGKKKSSHAYFSMTLFYWGNSRAPCKSCVIRSLLHPINGSRDLSTDKDLSARLYSLRDDRKSCREGNVYDGNLEKEQKETERKMREFQLQNDFMFHILALRNVP